MIDLQISARFYYPDLEITAQSDWSETLNEKTDFSGRVGRPS